MKMVFLSEGRKFINYFFILQIVVFLFSSCSSGRFVNMEYKNRMENFQVESVSGLNERPSSENQLPLVENLANNNFEENTDCYERPGTEALQESIKPKFKVTKAVNKSAFGFISEMNKILPLTASIDINKTNTVNKVSVKNDGRKTNGKALAGFILSLVGWVVPILGLAFILCVLGIIFSGIGISQISKDREQYKGMGFAIAGLVLGIIGVGISFLLAMAAAA